VLATPGHLSSGAGPVIAVVLGILLAVLLIALSVRRETQRVRTASHDRTRAHAVALVAKTSSLLQQSLDLGDLLPSLIVTLADDLDLMGAAVFLPNEQGELLEAFAVGQRPGGAPEALSELGRR